MMVINIYIIYTFLSYTLHYIIHLPVDVAICLVFSNQLIMLIFPVAIDPGMPRGQQPAPLPGAAQGARGCGSAPALRHSVGRGPSGCDPPLLVDDYRDDTTQYIDIYIDIYIYTYIYIYIDWGSPPTINHHLQERGIPINQPGFNGMEGF